MSSPPQAGKPKAGPKWVSRMGTAVRRSPSLLSRQQPEQDADMPTLTRTDSRDTVASATPSTIADPNSTTANSQKTPAKWVSKLGAATRRSPSSLSLSRPTASSAGKDRDAVEPKGISIHKTDSRESLTAKVNSMPSRPGTLAMDSTPQSQSGPKWTSRLGAAARRSPSMLSVARTSKDKEGDTKSVRNSSSRDSLASVAKSTPIPTPARKSTEAAVTAKKPSIPVSTLSKPTAGKATATPPRQASPIPPVAAKAILKTAKPITKPTLPPSPPPPTTTSTKVPANTTQVKPKPGWTSRMGGAVRRSSSLLSVTRPSTAATQSVEESKVKPASAKHVVDKATALAPTTLVVEVPVAAVQEVDYLAASPTDDFSAPISDVAQSNIVSELVEEPESIREDEEEEEERPISPFEDVPSQGSLLVDEVPAGGIPPMAFVDEPEDLVEDVTREGHVQDEQVRPKRAASPFEDVVPPPSMPEPEHVESILTSEAAVDPAAVVDELTLVAHMQVDRPKSPFEEDVASEPVRVLDAVVAPGRAPEVQEVVESSIEVRPKSPFEDEVAVGEDATITTREQVQPTAEPEQERARSPFADTPAILNDAVSAVDESDASVMALEVDNTLPVPPTDAILPSTYMPVSVATTEAIVPFESGNDTTAAVTTVSIEWESERAVQPTPTQTIVASEKVETEYEDQHQDEDDNEDPFADPPLSSAIAFEHTTSVDATADAEEPWTIVDTHPSTQETEIKTLGAAVSVPTPTAQLGVQARALEMEMNAPVGEQWMGNGAVSSWSGNGNPWAGVPGVDWDMEGEDGDGDLGSGVLVPVRVPVAAAQRNLPQPQHAAAAEEDDEVVDITSAISSQRSRAYSASDIQSVERRESTTPPPPPASKSAPATPRLTPHVPAGLSSNAPSAAVESKSSASATPPTFSVVTSPLRALRAPTMPIPRAGAHETTTLLGSVWAAASAVSYHPLAQDEAPEDSLSERSVRSGGSTTTTTTGTGSVISSPPNAVKGNGQQTADGTRPTPDVKRDPFADPYPPRPLSGTGADATSKARGVGSAEEYTTWNSVYEVIVGVISDIVTMSMRIIMRR